MYVDMSNLKPYGEFIETADETMKNRHISKTKTFQVSRLVWDKFKTHVLIDVFENLWYLRKDEGRLLFYMSRLDDGAFTVVDQNGL